MRNIIKIIDPLKSRDKSMIILEAFAEDGAKCSPKEAPLAQSINKMESSVWNKMRMLFNTVYHIAFHEMPFTAFLGSIKLHL